MKEKLSEIFEELKSVLSGKRGLLDGLLPPAIFLIVNFSLGFDLAVWITLTLGLFLFALRILKKQSVLFALAGLTAAALAALVAYFLRRASGFFLPGLLFSFLIGLGAFMSAILRRPLVAWTSYLSRRWPLNWYWHQNIRPAYTEVTLLWGFYFCLKAILQYSLYKADSLFGLGLLNILSGWPATILLLVISYLYGLWRLRTLKGPSVEEFLNDQSPPWTGQKKGFDHQSI